LGLERLEAAVKVARKLREFQALILYCLVVLYAVKLKKKLKKISMVRL